jgi:flagellar biogenesis protein FliO
MNDTFVRLSWALPLVLALAVAAALVLRRFIPQLQVPRPQSGRLALNESLQLSDASKVHLLSVDGQRILLVETRDQPSNVVFLPDSSLTKFKSPLTPWTR